MVALHSAESSDSQMLASSSLFSCSLLQQSLGLCGQVYWFELQKLLNHRFNFKMVCGKFKKLKELVQEWKEGSKVC